MKIPHNPIYLTGNEQQYIAEAIASGNLCGDGPFTRHCENWLEQTLQCKRALLTHSCTAALEMAVQLCELGPGDEVIIPSFTFTSTATAVVQSGATPVFVDIDPLTCNLFPQCIENAITSHTRCIIPVHYAGNACDMAAIMDIARRHSLWVIEDAAQGLLSQHENKYLGTIGHLGCLSFHESKNIQCGEGGALLINIPKHIARAEILREKGTNRAAFFRGQIDKYTWVDTGSSYLPNELTAAFLWAQLQKADWITSQKIKHLFNYHSKLKALDIAKKIILPPLQDPYLGNAHICYLLTASEEERVALTAHLKMHDILAFFHYVPLHCAIAGKKFGRISGQLPHTIRIANSLLRLPIYPHMGAEDVARVADAVNNFYIKR